MGSFAVEDFGLTKLLNIGNKDIIDRYHLFRKLTQL
jgi:cytidine kinase